MNPTSQEAFHAAPKTSGLAIGSLVCGILCVPIVSIVLGHLALSQIKRAAGAVSGKGMAIAGLILGYLTVLISLIGILSAIAIGPMWDLLFSSYKDASGQSLKGAYTALQSESYSTQLKWPGKETIGSAQNFAPWFVKKTTMDDANIWFLPNDPAIEALNDEGIDIPDKILIADGSLDVFKIAFGYNVAVPPAGSRSLKNVESGPYPIMWTRGLDRGQGGHRVERRRSLGRCRWSRSFQQWKSRMVRGNPVR